MKNYLETISIVNKKPLNLCYHQERIQEVFDEKFPQKKAWEIAELIPNISEEGWIKLRFVYNDNSFNIELSPYHKKTIQKLIFIDIEHYEYSHKYEDRRFLYELLKLHPEYDEVIMVKNGLVTDATIGNIALEKNGKWYTPQYPLLNGTKRRKLLKEKILIPKNIKKEEIQEYDKIAIINAFLDLEESNILSVSNAFL